MLMTSITTHLFPLNSLQSREGNLMHPPLNKTSSFSAPFSCLMKGKNTICALPLDGVNTSKQVNAKTGRNGKLTEWRGGDL